MECHLHMRLESMRAGVGSPMWPIRVLRSEQSSGGDEDSRIALEAGKPGW